MIDDKTKQVAEGFYAAGLDFILTELDTAMTFCNVALGSHDPAQAARDAEQAKRAYRTALRFKKRIPLYPLELEQINEKISRLESMFKRIEEDHHRENHQ